MFSDDDNDDDDDPIICAYLDSNEFNTLTAFSPGNFSIYYMNARSLCRHFFSIQDFLATLDHTFSIYGFAETWFKRDTAVCSHEQL